MRLSKAFIPAAIVTFGLTFSLTRSDAKPEYTKKEKTPCTTCHVAKGKKELNATGTCYQEHNHSLAECSVPKK